MKAMFDIYGGSINAGSCLGCDLVAGKVIAPGGILIETTIFIAVQDIETPIPGFIVITSKKHIKTILELSENEYKELFDLVYKIRSNMNMNLIPDLDHVSIIQKEVRDHFHLWLFPMTKSASKTFGNMLESYTKYILYSRKHHRTIEDIALVEKTFNVLKEALKN